MAKKSCRRKMNRMRKTKRHHRGGYQLQGADIKESLSGSSSSKMSMAQGEDFARYHAAQHGGVADYNHAFDTMTDAQMLASSMSDGPLRAIADVRGLSDAQPPPLGPTPASPGTTNAAFLR